VVYLSELTVDGRQHDKRSLLADSHAMHRWIMRAFPSRESGEVGRVLYRCEAAKLKRAIIVQSEREPDWSKHQDEGVKIRGPKQWLVSETASPVFAPGQVLRFRLLANPIVSREGKRHALTNEAEQIGWLTRKGIQCGFELVPVRLSAEWVDPFGDEDGMAQKEDRVLSRGLLRGNKGAGKDSAAIAHFGVEFEGLLKVIDSDLFVSAIRQGVGPAKGFGFGLLSIAKV